MGREHAEELIGVLKESPLFSGIKGHQLRAVADLASLQQFDANQMVVREGENAANFYLILDGQVEVRHPDRPPAKLGRGQFFGETTLVDNSTRSAGVLALRRTRCLVLSGSVLRSYPAVALKLLEESSRRDYSHQSGPGLTTSADQTAVAVTQSAIEFKSEKTRILFERLTKSFTEDYMVRRRYFEQAGWRTFGELSKEAGISRASLYGQHGNYGSPVNELLSRGLIEVRVFTGQRGRGGEVLRARIAYDKEPVKRYVDQAILKRK